MLLQSIKLENFRQFRNESIDFADGSDGKNVTIRSPVSRGFFTEKSRVKHAKIPSP